MILHLNLPRTLKQDLQSREPSTATTRTTAISPVNTPSSDKIARFRLVDWFAGFMGSEVAGRDMKSTGSKKYQPESFKEVELGLQTQATQSQKSITGYHYYNLELPSTAWDEITNGTDLADSGWSVEQLGTGFSADTFISTIFAELTPAVKTPDVPDVPVVEQISQLSIQLGCPNTILTAKGLDFIVDKLELRTTTHPITRGKLLKMLTSILFTITDKLAISQSVKELGT